MKKVNLKNVSELLGVVIAFVLSMVCVYKATTTNIPVNYLLASLCLNFIWLVLSFDIASKIRG